MKYALSTVIYALALLAVVFAYPGGRQSDFESDEDAEKVGPIIVLSAVSDPLEDGFGTGFFGSVKEDPFNGFLASMQSMMNRLRQRIAQSLPNLPVQGSFFGLTNIPEGANTTSTTKVINGHVVTVNETTYSDGDDVQGTVVRVRVIDIKPEDEGAIGITDSEDITAAPDSEDIFTGPASTDRSVESVENIADNEIPERLVQAA